MNSNPEQKKIMNEPCSSMSKLEFTAIELFKVMIQDERETDHSIFIARKAIGKAQVILTELEKHKEQ